MDTQICVFTIYPASGVETTKDKDFKRKVNSILNLPVLGTVEETAAWSANSRVIHAIASNKPKQTQISRKSSRSNAHDAGLDTAIYSHSPAGE